MKEDSDFALKFYNLAMYKGLTYYGIKKDNIYIGYISSRSIANNKINVGFYRLPEYRGQRLIYNILNYYNKYLDIFKNMIFEINNGNLPVIISDIY